MKPALPIAPSVIRFGCVVCCAALVTLACAAAGDRSAVEYLHSGKVLPEGLPFSEVVRAGDTLYLSGQVGVAPGTMELVPGGIGPETRRTMDNIALTLEEHGAAMADLVKCTAMLADISEWSSFNEIYATYFDGRFPARSAMGVNGLALGARVEVECIAVLDN